MPIIDTYDSAGHVNGYLIPLWNVTETDGELLRPDQVYLTTIKPGASKGPHLHMVREQRYYVIRGIVEVIWREHEEIEVATHEGVSGISGYRYGRRLLRPGDPCCVIHPGCASELRNMGADEVWLINMPAPAWTAQDPDEWPVEGWSPDA